MSIKSLAERIGMDYDSVIEDFCGDVSALKDSLKAFHEAEDINNLKKAVESMDIEGIRKASHKIRNEHLEKLHAETLKAIEEENL